MRILFVLSFYSALRESYINQKWEPTGMPAVVYLFENLQKRNDYFDCFFVEQTYNKDFPRNVKLNNFSGDFRLINPLYISNLFGKIKVLKHLIKILNYINAIINILKLNNKYDIYYIDRANVVIGAFLSFLLRKKVLLRLHGVNEMNSEFRKVKFRLWNPLVYLSFKAPFSYIVCSEDGAPGKQFLDSFTNNNVKKEILLNGVNFENDNNCNIRDVYNIPKNKTLLLFVGRIEKGKGVGKFIHTILKLNNITDKYYTIIVGDGLNLEYFKSKCNEYSNIVFTGAIQHSKIGSYYRSADIFISLNVLGNLCNTTLEALKAGNCIITYKKEISTGKDCSTAKYLDKTVLFINRDNVESELLQILVDLTKNEKLVRQAKSNSIKFSNDNLTNWSQRIDYEINIIKDVVSAP